MVLNFLKTLLFLTFCLISLGGAVRAMDAGLACPDWPLCFGDVIPDFQVQVYYEFIHRVLAGIVGLLTFGLGFHILKKKNFSIKIKKTIILALLILIIQIIMGGLTVLKLLHSGVVTTHLVLGVTFFSLLLWLHFQLKWKPLEQEIMPISFRSIFIFGALVISGQIFLGGMVSTNYAGLACLDFPLCNGQWVPTWTGPQGLQVIHRFGAYFTFTTLVLIFLQIRKNNDKNWMSEAIKKLGILSLVLISAQVLVGIVNVLFRLPPVITVLHLALAVSILGVYLKLIFLGVRKPI